MNVTPQSMVILLQSIMAQRIYNIVLTCYNYIKSFRFLKVIIGLGDRLGLGPWQGHAVLSVHACPFPN